MINCYGSVDGYCVNIYKSNYNYVLIIAYYEENESIDDVPLRYYEIRINDVYGVLRFVNFNKFIGQFVLVNFDICSVSSPSDCDSYSSCFYLRSIKLKELKGYYHG